MPDHNSRPSSVNTGQVERAVGGQPEKVGSRVRANETVRAERGGDTNLDVRGKVTEARSRFFDDANHTGQDSQEIVQYQRSELLGPLLHR